MVPLEWTPVQTENSKGYKKYVKAIIACVILTYTVYKKNVDVYKWNGYNTKDKR